MMDVDLLSEYLINYWKAIFSYYPDTSKNPKEYTIAGYTGLFTFHNLFPTIYSIALFKFGNIDIDELTKIISISFSSYTQQHEDPLFKEKIYEEYWHKKRGKPLFQATNKKLINELTNKLRQKILYSFKIFY